jgi:superfamily II DNA or RNA helicase
MNDDNDVDGPEFRAKDELELLQLRTRKTLAEANEELNDDARDKRPNNRNSEAPQHWHLTGDLDLYEWQQECLDAWFANDGSGTAKVVTGAGKTVMALALTAELQNREESDLRVAVVVPQINLMNQWYDEILELGNLPESSVARLGGEFDGNFHSGTRILLGVVNSMRNSLATLVEQADVGGELLLIADECHHYGSQANSRIFQTERAYSLGLSATPERSDMEEGYDGSLLGEELGNIIYELTLEDALELGIVPPYRIAHYGLPMTAAEKHQYEQLSRSISDLRSELQGRAPAGRSSGASFFAWLEEVRNGDGDLAQDARQFDILTSKRKELVYGMEARGQAALELIDSELESNPDARILLFHERIREVNHLYRELADANYPVALEHSKLPDSIRRRSIELFRDGTAQILVSAKSLIEGFDVPECDVGIIVAANKSDRQRIQSLGRMLRNPDDGEDAKRSSIHVLYGKETTDEQIYAQTDWEKITGVEQNEYYEWTPGEELQPKDGPPQRPLPGEEEIEGSQLEQGDVYPGAYEGEEFTCDSQRNVRTESGQFWADSEEIAELVRDVKGSFGRFRVTPQNHFVLVPVKKDEDWEIRYVTKLDQPPELEEVEENKAGESGVDLDAWVEEADIGDDYPVVYSPDDSRLTPYEFTKKRGGRLRRPIPDGSGKEWSKMPGDANSETKAENAARAVYALRDLQSNGVHVSDVVLNEHDHLLYRRGGSLHFLCEVPGGFEFPSDN